VEPQGRAGFRAAGDGRRIIDFCWTKEQSDLYETVLEFARGKLNDSVKEREPAHSFGSAEWRMCGEAGLLALCVPERLGGRGLGVLDTAHIMEAFGRGCEDMGLVFSASAHTFACEAPIAQYGGTELVKRLLPRLSSGDWIGANAITEKDAGSDIFALKTRAERDGAHYVLTGAKSYVSNGPIADVFIIYASTNPAHGFMGITAFAVERETPGLSVGEPLKKIGLTTAPASPLYLDRCRVPASNLLGSEGQGARVFHSSMQLERVCLFAAYLGMMERQLDLTIAFAKERRQFGKPISKNQAISHRIVDMKLRLDAARLLIYRACWLVGQQKDAALEVSLAKLAVSEAAIQSGLDAIQIHGSAGIDVEAGIERTLRDAIPGTIFSGTSEIQRNLIARELGL
jgi:alkylation response protein AidB-like acyl-CoA dehydrogenase